MTDLFSEGRDGVKFQTAVSLPAP